MQKIMFDDRFGLTGAVVELRKNMTRRFAEKVLVEDENGELHWNGEFKKPRYKVGEVVAVAQPYSEIMPYLADSFYKPEVGFMEEKPGYRNKMFVKADLMPHQILINGHHVELLQDISDEDCLREGIIKYTCNLYEFMGICYSFDGDKAKMGTYLTARDAFADLIRKISGKRVWDDNPYVDVYEFELIK